LCKQFGLLQEQGLTPNVNISTRREQVTEKTSPKVRQSPVKIQIRTTVKNPTRTSKNQTLHINPTSKISTIALDMDKIFTGIPDTDLMILINTNSIKDIVNIYNTSKYFRNLLNQPSSWKVVQQYFKVFQLNNFLEVAILKQELDKTKMKYKLYRGNEIYDFTPGDRVIITSKPENYVVVEVKSPNITLQQVDMFGRPSKGFNLPSSDKLITGKLRGDKAKGIAWGWYYGCDFGWYYGQDLKTTEWLFGINNDAGYRITSLDSPYLKYKTLPSEMQHGKPIKDEESFYSHGDEAYLTKLKRIAGLITSNGTIKNIYYKMPQFIPDFEPEIGTLVEVMRECKGKTACVTNIYYIEAMEYGKLLLKLVPEISPAYGYGQIPDTIIAIKKDDTWYEKSTDQHLNLIFGSGYVHNYVCGYGY
jgi:hypothetical protein